MAAADGWAERLPTIGLAVAVAGGAALRFNQALKIPSHLSADEESYGHLAVNISRHLAYSSPHMGDALHWAPGAPALFALAARITTSGGHAKFQIPAIYWAQALVGIALIAAVYLLVRKLVAHDRAGRWAATLAALAIAFYPPLISLTNQQLSEPLGALLLVAALLALARALEWPTTERLVVCGAVLGALILTRADLLLAPLIVAVVAGLWFARREPRRAAWRKAALIVLGALVIAGPWVLLASARRGRPVPISTGGSSTLFVGTYLPGDGTIFGAKRKLADAARRLDPKLARFTTGKIPEDSALRVIAARYPHSSFDAAMWKASFHNIGTYAFGQPLSFAAMMARKFSRLWFGYYRGTAAAKHTRAAVLIYHLVLVALGFAGLVAGIVLRRNPVLIAALAIIVYSTLDNMVLVAEARHNVPLLPLLVACGAAGWWLARTRTGDAAQATVAADPAPGPTAA